MTDPGTHHPDPSGEAEERYPRPFGKYVLLNPLAEGGMGAVFHAKTGGVAGIEKLCVVKTLRPHFTADREYTARFIDEARVVVQLNHRNICSVFDVGKVGMSYFLAMEYISGRDLRTMQERLTEGGGKLTEAACLHLIMEVLDALDYAHRLTDDGGTPLHLVHRDVSPQNVMVNFEGEVKLIDFGLASSAVKGEKTEPHLVMGKVAYMAPEQARGDPVDGRSDLFAAGILLYELLAGERYYEGKSPHEIWAISGLGEYNPPKLAELDPSMQAILRRALSPRLEERFARCADFREELESYQLQHGIRGGDGGRELRTIMGEMFAQERADERKLIGQLKNLEPLPAAPVAKEESRTFAAVTPGGGFFIGPVTGPELKAHDPTEAYHSAPQTLEPSTEPTAAHNIIARERRKAVVGFAAGLGVVVALGLLVALVFAGGDDDESAPPAVATVTATDATPPAPDDKPPEDTQPGADKPDDGAVAAAAAAVTDAGVAAPDKAPEPPPTVTPKKPRERRGRRSRARNTKPKPPSSPMKGVVYLKKHCPELKCTADAVAAKKRLVTLLSGSDTGAMVKQRKIITSCVRRCAKK
jgi:serine/threonine-protein kinase